MKKGTKSERKLSAIRIPYKISESPQTFWQSIRKVPEKEFQNANDGHTTRETQVVTAVSPRIACVVDGDDVVVIEAALRNLSSIFVRFALVRTLIRGYAQRHHESAFLPWCNFSRRDGGGGGGGGSRIYPMLAHPDIAAMFRNEQLQRMIPHPKGTEESQKRVKQAERIFKKSTGSLHDS